jgi:hypothetical protein
VPSSEAFPVLDPARGDGLLADPSPLNSPWREGVTGREPAPGDGTIADPAPEPCGSHLVTSQTGNAQTGSGTPAPGEFPPADAISKVPNEWGAGLRTVPCPRVGLTMSTYDPAVRF